MTDRELMQQAFNTMEQHFLHHENGCAYLSEIYEALRARLAQPNDFNPDWDAMAVMVEEQQRMAKKVEEVTDALQAALKAEKQEPVVWMYQDKSTNEVKFQKHMRAFVDHGVTYEVPLYAAPQPEEAPYDPSKNNKDYERGFIDGMQHQMKSSVDKAVNAMANQQKTSGSPMPRPVAVWELQEGGWDTIANADWMETLPVGTKLYTAAQKKEWVGLTDEEMMIAAFQAGFAVHEDYDNEDDPDALHWWSEDGEPCDDTLHKLRDIIEAKLKEKNT